MSKTPPESDLESFKRVLDYADAFIQKTKEYIEKYVPEDSIDDIEQLRNEAVILPKYDAATLEAVRIGRILARAWIIKLEVKKCKTDIQMKDIKIRRLMAPLSARVDGLLSETEDIIQAITAIKSSIDGRAKFYEKAQFILFAQKTFV